MNFSDCDIQLYIPNSFTPNGDGLNDTFWPVGLLKSVKQFNFQIFNRWGELLFESNRTNSTWDALYQGKLVQEGIYVWKLFFTDKKGVNHRSIGNVNVIR